MTAELDEMKENYEELRMAKQEAVRELLTLQEQHKAELRIVHNSQQEEATARENLERRLCELRSEVFASRTFEFPQIVFNAISSVDSVGTTTSRKCSRMGQT